MQQLHIALRIAVLLFAALFALAPHTSAAQPYGQAYVFGDSTADVGNVFLATQPPAPLPIPPAQTYHLGHFSNGPVFPEYLVGVLMEGKPLGQPGSVLPSLAAAGLAPGLSVSFAFGGSGTGASSRTPGGFSVPGLLGQVAAFRALPRDPGVAGSALYVIATGSNDYLFAPLNAPVAPPVAVGNIAKAIRLLYAEGGRTFVVLNVPDLGHLPLTSNRPDWRKLSALAEQHNALLAKTVSTLRAQLPGARLVLVDLQAPPLPPGLEMTVPALELLAPGTSTCLFTNPASCPTVSFDVDSRYFYWDAEHPTTATHVLLAGYLLSLVLPSP